MLACKWSERRYGRRYFVKVNGEHSLVRSLSCSNILRIRTWKLLKENINNYCYGRINLWR